MRGALPASTTRLPALIDARMGWAVRTRPLASGAAATELKSLNRAGWGWKEQSHEREQVCRIE